MATLMIDWLHCRIRSVAFKKIRLCPWCRFANTIRPFEPSHLLAHLAFESKMRIWWEKNAFIPLFYSVHVFAILGPHIFPSSCPLRQHMSPVCLWKWIALPPSRSWLRWRHNFQLCIWTNSSMAHAYLSCRMKHMGISNAWQNTLFLSNLRKPSQANFDITVPNTGKYLRELNSFRMHLSSFADGVWLCLWF